MDGETCSLDYFAMSQEIYCIKKKKIQPCIMSMLSPSVELSELNTTNPSPIKAPFHSVKSKKRKRSRNSGELSHNNHHKKTVTKTPKKTSNPSAQWI